VRAQGLLNNFSLSPLVVLHVHRDFGITLYVTMFVPDFGYCPWSCVAVV
jgi:hypothetical protein